MSVEAEGIDIARCEVLRFGVSAIVLMIGHAGFGFDSPSDHPVMVARAFFGIRPHGWSCSDPSPGL